MDQELVKKVEDIYRDPQQAVQRYGAKAHADLVVIELALLDEVRELAQFLRGALLEAKGTKRR